ncbi:MAG: response regulator [Bdellovibrionales bacterium]|nr:response regulator [Bdellovibrionales bacterium]
MSEVSSRPAKILIADDCEHSRNLIELALIEEGYDLRICEDGDQALSAFSEFQPDMLILDVQMPGASGIEVCRWVKSHATSFTPTMLLTSQAELIDKVNGLDCGADEYVTKPFALPELAARTRALLRIKDLTNRLQETQSLLAHKERELVASQVAGAAAHELGQPLTAMLLNCQLLAKLSERSEIESKPELIDVLTRIEKQCKIMDHILKALNEVDSYRTRSYVGQLEIVDLSLGGDS